MAADTTHLLVQHLIAAGWTVVEWSDGPFAKYAAKAVVA